jgi:hypothetical protein
MSSVSSFMNVSNLVACVHRPLVNEMRAEQAFVNITQLADFERAVVNGFVGAELALARAGACGRLRENQLPENVGEGCVADAPGFELRMEIGVEQSAVVAGKAA